MRATRKEIRTKKLILLDFVFEKQQRTADRRCSGHAATFAAVDGLRFRYMIYDTFYFKGAVRAAAAALGACAHLRNYVADAPLRI